MDLHTRRYEELQMNAFPALHTELYDGWILKYSEGFTYRGNCIVPLYEATMEWEAKRIECEKRYQKSALPVVFKVRNDIPTDYADNLIQSGYQNVKTVNLMTMDLTVAVNSQHNTQSENSSYGKDMKENGKVFIEKGISDLWLCNFRRLCKIEDKRIQKIQENILKNIHGTVLTAKMEKDGITVGSGYAVLEDGKIGIYGIHTHENYRRQGIGYCITEALIQDGIKLGMKEAYLLVFHANETAKRLYSRLGFHFLYSYSFYEKMLVGSRKIID